MRHLRCVNRPFGHRKRAVYENQAAGFCQESGRSPFKNGWDSFKNNRVSFKKRGVSFQKKRETAVKKGASEGRFPLGCRQGKGHRKRGSQHSLVPDSPLTTTELLTKKTNFEVYSSKGGFYKLALPDFEAVSESISSASKGVMRALRPSEVAIWAEKSPKDSKT